MRRCKYCEHVFVWQKVEVPRPIPEGARDLGLVDEWVRVVCRGCGASHYLHEVMIEEAYEGYLCQRCRRPVFPGDRIWILTDSSDPVGGPWGLGNSRRHYGCMSPEVYPAGDPHIREANRAGGYQGWYKYDPTRAGRGSSSAGCCLALVAALLPCALVGIYAVLR